MTTTLTAARAARTTTKQRVGLVLAGLFCLSNVPSFLEGGADSGEAGPPEAILVLSSVLGVIGLVAAIWAWRGNRVALRVCAGAIVIETLSGVPAFFVDVPMWVKGLVAASVVLTVVIVVLLFSDERRADVAS